MSRGEASNAELVDAFISWKQHNRGRSAGTAQLYRRALGRLAEFLGEGRPLLQASEDELIAFTGPWLAKRGVVALSRRPYVAAVRAFYTWARARQLTAGNASAAVNYPAHGVKLPDVITIANAEKLMWAPDFQTFKGIRDGAMLALLLGSGIRVSGLVGLDQEDLSEQLVDGRRRLFATVREKGDRQRQVPIPPEADLQLRAYLEHRALAEIDRATRNGRRVLFVTTGNRNLPPAKYRGEKRRFTRRAVNKMLLAYGREHGIPDAQLHPHAMRHLFGTELAEGDVDIRVAQQLMGHRDIKSTGIYTHLATRKLVKEADRANPLAKMRTPTTDILKRLKA